MPEPSAAAPQLTPSAAYPPPPTDATAEQQREYQRGLWNHLLLDDTWRQTRFNPAPNLLLTETVGELAPGTALDVNMGEGRNALHLARLGWQVTGVDIADAALRYAQQRARQLGVALTTIEHDAASFDWGHHCWDLLVLCYADEQTHAERAAAALKPGGLVVFENFHYDVNEARKNPPSQQIGFRTQELPDLYSAAGFRILRYEEPVAIADFSRETQRLVRLVAQKL
ncbi:class I SAM-dependent methyltransferase [Hymenobacter cellulosilyticus]|uniref:Methyltransferase domain-containing protein n=1 Tax=Hymenobacter cellulosilyticus TaxID=2932248 RepID=A0A8T9Q0X7_9BACT|nr:class I SAM-dependent methyltransferase [Hymenobacter cellulosilyticus]UOQ71104.1 methyltransferase domain-containing protein [Hymenobacter cellulosilyticus]